jgi:hypothetical protein
MDILNFLLALLMDNWSELLALAAFGVSVLSAIYARRAIDEAKKANRLSVHDHRLEIYREFETVRFAVRSKGLGIKHIDIAGLYRPSQESAFYFPEAISAKLVEYVDTCFALAELNRKLQFRAELSDEEKNNLRRKQDALSEKERLLAKTLTSEIRSNLDVVV